MTSLRSVTFRDWSFGYGRATRRPTYDEAEARRRFDAGETLHALFGDESSPEVVLCVELPGRLVEVVWLDRLNRPELGYVFHQPDGWPDDELFLSQTRLTTYDHNVPLPEGEPSSNEVWFFKPDGSLHGARAASEGPTERTDGQLDADQLLLHRERRPAFGEWASLLRQER